MFAASDFLSVEMWTGRGLVTLSFVRNFVFEEVGISTRDEVLHSYISRPMSYRSTYCRLVNVEKRGDFLHRVVSRCIGGGHALSRARHLVTAMA